MPLDQKKLDAALAEVKLDQAKLDAAMAELQPPPEPSNSAARLLGQAGSGINGGMAQAAGLFGAPVDAVNALGTMAGLPMSDRPVMGSRWITENVAGLMPDPQQPQTGSERIVDRIGQEIGASVPTAGAGLALRGATQAGAIARPMLQGVGESLLKLSPAKLMATEAAMATSAGTGAALAREAFPDSKTAELVGQLVGGVGLPTAYSIVKGLANKARTAVGFMNDDEVATAAAEQLDRHIPRGGDEFLPDPLAAGLAERDAIRADIPGFSPTTAQVTGSPSMAAAERAARSSNPAFAHRFEDLQSRTQEEFRDFFERIPGVPRGAATIADTQDALRKVVDEHVKLAETAASRAVKAIPGMTADDAGRVLRAQLNNAEADFRTAAEVLFDKVDRGNTIQLPFEDIATTALMQVKDRPLLDAADDLPGAAVEIKKFVDSKLKASMSEKAAGMGFPDDAEVIDMLAKDELPNLTISFNDLRSIRSRLVNDLRNAKAAPVETRRNVKVARLSELLSSVDNTLDDMATNAAPEIAQAYRTANSFYRDGVRRFRQGAAAAVKAVDGAGRERVADNLVGGQFFKPGPLGQRAGEDFQAAMVRLNGTPEGAAWVATPEGQSALRDYALNTLAKTGDTEGRLSVKGIQAWRAKHQEALGMFPDIDDQTASLEKAQKLLEDNAAVLKRSADDVEKGALAGFLKADPEKAVGALLSGPAPAQSAGKLRKLIAGNEEAENGLRRSVIDWIESKSETGKLTTGGEIPFLSPYKLRQLRKDLKGVLPQIYDKEHLRKLSVAQQAAEVVARSERSRVAGADTFEKAVAGAGNHGLTAVQLFEALPGVRGATRLATLPIRAWKGYRSQINNSKIERLFQDALIDPDAADILYWHIRGAKPETTIRRLNLHLANRLPGVAQTLDEFVPDATAADELPTPQPTPRATVTFTGNIPPPPAPKPPKPPKPTDVSKELARGKLVPSDLPDLARATAGVP